MLNSILKRFPHLTEDDVMLQDDGDGVYVKVWNDDSEIPTSEELVLWDAEDMKNYTPPKSDKERIVELESVVDQLILDSLMGV